MYGNQTNKIQEWARLSSREYLATFLVELSELEHHKVVVMTPGDVFRIKELLKVGATNYFKSIQYMHEGFSEWYGQEVDFVHSNLGRGYQCYFICNRCERRVKYLYFDSRKIEPLCRVCQKLHYAQPGRKIRRLSKLLHRSYLSSEAKQIIIEQAQITEADLRQKASIQN